MTSFVCRSAAEFFFPGVKTLNYCVNKDIFEPRDWQSAGSSVSRSISQWNHRVQVIVLFVARTSAKVTFTSDMQAEQMQPTLRSSSFWTMQLTGTHSTTCDESQNEMMNWFPQQLLTHLYAFCRKVYNSFYSSCNNAILKKKPISLQNNSLTIKHVTWCIKCKWREEDCMYLWWAKPFTPFSVHFSQDVRWSSRLCSQRQAAGSSPWWSVCACALWWRLSTG